jgi:hypothetical protein
MKLVEEISGTGDLTLEGALVRQVRYEIRRFQGMSPSGLPIPGWFRIEGTIDIDSAKAFEDCLQTPLTLRLEDGRALRISLADATGRVLSEGHGPMKCLCC